MLEYLLARIKRAKEVMNTPPLKRRVLIPVPTKARDGWVIEEAR